MCYESLIDGRAREQSPLAILRGERWDAFVNGLEAALLVFVVLVWQGTGPVLLLGATVAAVPLGYVLHQVVLLAGIGIVRLSPVAGDGETASAG